MSDLKELGFCLDSYGILYLFETYYSHTISSV